MNSKTKRLTLLLLLLFVTVGCDQATKSVAQRHLSDRAAQSFLGDLFRLDYAENPGAFLSLGSALPDPLRTWIFTGLVALFLIGLAIFIWRGLHQEPPWILIALTLFLAGGVGNLIDRLVNDGHVIDFMNMGVGRLRTGVFNVADMALMAGVGILLFSSLLPLLFSTRKDIDHESAQI